jgi:hypothetical protein
VQTFSNKVAAPAASAQVAFLVLCSPANFLRNAAVGSALAKWEFMGRCKRVAPLPPPPTVKGRVFARAGIN